jgi:hypothetical protein
MIGGGRYRVCVWIEGIPEKGMMCIGGLVDFVVVGAEQLLLYHGFSNFGVDGSLEPVVFGICIVLEGLCVVEELRLGLLAGIGKAACRG